MEFSIFRFLSKKDNPILKSNLATQAPVNEINQPKVPLAAKSAVTESLLTYLLMLEVIRRTLPLESEKNNSEKTKSNKEKFKNNSYYKKWKKRTIMLK